ncbi:HSP90 family protein [uncultured Clostridium sp.]|uniref:HSP90 family protein n=1 Tax=uncultured Clostridium sp. TaxID=59620 RepID=UPI0028ED7AFB|nr:HSP90 family protein [uncultured Clostridium sp.]
MEKNYNFQVNLDGIISLLSENLYSNPGVYIREVLQNAIDAITAHKKVNDALEGVVNFELYSNTLIIEDNGIGLTLEDIHTFLSVIGQSSKRKNLGLSSNDFIGRFGIGLLSCFIVCDEITLITKSIYNDETYEWKGKNDGTYTIKKIDASLESGTRVYLKAKEDCEEFFDYGYVYDTLKYYGKFLPYKILLNSEGRNKKINKYFAPWKKDILSKEYWFLVGKEEFKENFIDCIPIKSSTGNLNGVAYILSRSISISSKIKGKVYVKDMFVSDNCEKLMPSWAFFIKPLLNAEGIRLTASREDFFEDKALEKMREEISDCIKNYFYKLAATDRKKLVDIINVHYDSLKLMAIEEDELYSILINYLPFQTSLGKKTLWSIYEEFKYIKYTLTVDEFKQIEKTAKAQNICIINGGYVNDADLVEKFNECIKLGVVERVKPEDITEEFEGLNINEMNETFDLIDFADGVLRKEKCSCSIKKFEPEEIPVIYNISEEAKFLKEIEETKEESFSSSINLFGEIASIFEEEIQEGFASLCFNYNNFLVRRLIECKDNEVKKAVIEILYVQSLMLGNYPIKNMDNELFANGVNKLINLVLEEK